MTIIFSNSEMWIESHEVSLAPAAGATTFSTIVLDKAGRYIGGSATSSCNNSNNTLINSGIRDNANNPLVFGTAIVDFRAWVRNDDVGTNTVTVLCLIFLRK